MNLIFSDTLEKLISPSEHSEKIPENVPTVQVIFSMVFDIITMRCLQISTASRGVEAPPSSTQQPPRFSPNALERKMAAELNLLESMEESMRQITGVERSRAVSMAQQETVSLAQILKVC